MSDLILPNGKAEEDPYDFHRDLAEFSTKVTRAIMEHQKLHPATMIGALSMISSDLHHNVITQMQQNQMAQAALAKVNADRLRRNIN